MPADNVALFEITIGGTPLPSELMDAIHAIDVDSSLFLPAAATIELYDHKLKWVDDTRFKVGEEVEISAGSNTAASEDGNTSAKKRIFKGRIAAIEPTYSFGESAYGVLVIRAYDALYFLHRGTSVKSFENVTDSDLVKKLAGEVGLTAKVTATTLVHPHILRDGLSDYEFLKELAARNGYVVVCDDRTLKFVKPTEVSSAEVALAAGRGLLEFRPSLNVSGQVSKVTISQWDRQQKKVVTGQAAGADYAPNELGWTQRGHQLVTAGVRASTLHRPDPPGTQSNAELSAKALFNRIAANDFTGEGVARGNPALVAGCKIDVSEVGARFSGKYFVTRVRHRYEPKEAYTTEFWVGGMSSGTLASLVSERDQRSSSARRVPGLMTAVVTNNTDPEKLGRVRLMYPEISEQEEAFWVPVASAGAGKDRGFMVVPEVNDEVLVGFVHGDVNRPMVLGGLWNGKDTPPESAATANGNVDLRTFKTRSGHILRFSDKAGSEKIELIDKTGKNLIEIDSTANHIKITSTQDITVEAKGNLTLKGMNVAVQAQGKLELKGTTTELAGSGQTKISGPMVMIN